MKDFYILIVDDEQAQLIALETFLKKRKYNVVTFDSAPKALQHIQNRTIDLILSDFRMPELSGLELLKEVKSINPEIPFIIMTAFSAPDEAVQVMKAGAFDYLSKPVDLEELEFLIRKAYEHTALISENKILREKLSFKADFKTIITHSPLMEEVLSTAFRVAPSKAAILIRGESGTGKELIARTIHEASPRSGKQMITVNCAALNENLLESELFGHEKGAFTGAQERRIGRLEQADGSTLFLDEIGDVPLQTQVKLLRAIQFGEFERVGGNQTIKTDVRIISATHQPLEDKIKSGLFREDLFFRINVVTVQLPPLRRRKEDIPLLVDHFLKKFTAENDKAIDGISKEAMDQVIKYNFPGNVRELENLMERAVVMARGTLITQTDLPELFSSNYDRRLVDPYDCTDNYMEKVARFERIMIEEALKQKNGNQSKAAELLGISERHLRSRMQKLNIINNQR